MATSELKNTLVVGHPRSGTTWLSEILGAGRPIVSEPDNEVSHPLGFGFKRSHRFPSPEDFAASGLPEIFRRAATGDPNDFRRRVLQRALLRLRWHVEPWVATNCGSTDATVRHATRMPSLPPTQFPGQLFAAACRRSMPALRKDPDGRFIKSVHGLLVAEQIQETIDCRVVVVVRNPFAVLASLRRPLVMAGLSDRIRNPDGFRAIPGLPTTGHTRDAVQVVHLMKKLLEQADRHPEWIVVSHDELCRDPHDGFERLADALDLGVTPVLHALGESVGTGTGLSVRRTSSLDQIDGWQQELDRETVDHLRLLIRDFELDEGLEALRATGQR